MIHRLFYFGLGAAYGYCCQARKHKRKKDEQDLKIKS